MTPNQMLPGVRVCVATPTNEHQSYQNATGRIVDVRDFSEHRHCQVLLDQTNELTYFESTELTLEVRQQGQSPEHVV